MNNKRIIDYVMQSPNNTNPAVLESMLEAIIGDGGASSGSGGKYNQVNYMIPAGTIGDELFCVSETIPDIKAGAVGFTAALATESLVSFKMGLAQAVEAEGVVVIRCGYDLIDPEDDDFQLLIADEANAETLGVSKGVYLIKAKTISKDVEVNIFWKNP